LKGAVRMFVPFVVRMFSARESYLSIKVVRAIGHHDFWSLLLVVNLVFSCWCIVILLVSFGVVLCMLLEYVLGEECTYCTYWFFDVRFLYG